MRPLPHPPDAEKDTDSLEMLRGWVVDGELQLAIATWVWQDDPESWGRLLAEAAAHVADAVAAETGQDRTRLFERISESLRHHLEHPPTDLEGRFVEPV
jgi:Domain of unknown function (DUF5076)